MPDRKELHGEVARSVVKARIAAEPAGGAATAEELELEDEPSIHP